MIHVTNDFEGANPHAAGDVERTGDDAFVIRPYSEDGDGNYKFNLLVGVANRSRKPVEAAFVVDWADAEYNACRDYVLLGRSDQWRQFPAARCSGGRGSPRGRSSSARTLESISRTERFWSSCSVSGRSAIP